MVKNINFDILELDRLLCIAKEVQVDCDGGRACVITSEKQRR